MDGHADMVIVTIGDDLEGKTMAVPYEEFKRLIEDLEE